MTATALGSASVLSLTNAARAYAAAQLRRSSDLSNPPPCPSRLISNNARVVKRDDDWRARGMSLFPELRDRREDTDDILSIYIVLSELLSMLEIAHREDDDASLRRIYGYASLVREQRDDELQNAAGVSFYEHLFDQRWMRPLVVPWINSTIVREYMELWEWRLAPNDLEEVRQLLYRGRLLHVEGQKRKRRR